MKKRALLLGILMIFVAVCGAEAKMNLTLATGGTSGTYYAVGGVLATVLNPVLKESNLVVTSTGASKANIQLMQDKEADIAILQNDVAYYAYTGTDLFEGEEPWHAWGTLCTLYDETVQVFSLNPNFKTFSDLKGKTVSVGAPGSGDNFCASQVFAEFGMSFSDVNAVFQSYGDSAESLKDGKIDAAFCCAGAPTVALVDLAASANRSLNVITLEDEHIANLQAKYPFYAKITLPAGTYNGLDRPTTTVAIRATLVARNDVPENVVYEIMKAIFDNQQALANGHAKFAGITPEGAIAGISIPCHPGAKKFFAEKGITVE